MSAEFKVGEFKVGSRASRASESRAHDSRDTEKRPAIVFEEGSAFNVPESIRLSDPEHAYGYVPYQSGGVDLKHQYEDAVYRRGYMPVKRSSHPLLSRNMIDSPFAPEAEDDLVKVKGHVLMKRTQEMEKAESDFYEERNARQNYIREMHSQAAGNPSAPRMFEDSRRYSPKGT